ALGIALILAALLGGRLLLTPARGDVLVLVSAQRPDRLPVSTVALHSAAGWADVGASSAHTVPAAPQTATLVQASVPVGSYDAVRLGGETLPVQVQVQRTALAPILIAIASGRPVKQGIYAGSEAVSLGLSQLSGQMKTMPSFNLLDQFGRSFTDASVAGHNVILAAFHTTCHESCPLYTGLFLQLQKQLPTSVMLIEATINPSEDTPEVLRDYAGRVGASWTFLTGEPTALAEFWKPFDVELGSGDVHRSTLALIDSHGYIRSYYLGAPDVGTSLPPELASQLNPAGMRLAGGHGDGWGPAQVLVSLRAIGGLGSPPTAAEGEGSDFTLPTLDGKKASLGEFRGRPVLINFWATYCVPCRVEMPLIERMAKQHPGLVVLLVDERDSTAAARTFVADLHLHSTVLLDSEGKVGDSYRITGLPTTVFVRSDGTIEGRYIGQTNEQVLGSHIATLGA
ncbi:redoxin family protein, partial [Candidatus Nephthysia bennettiae]|nr:SCO family protein [Candidatus Dormibacteraeota bacterium]